MLSQPSTLIALAMLSLSLTSAHMTLNTPIPYGKSTLNNSPLVNAYPGTAQSDFPCKLRGKDTYTITTMNTLPIGIPQILSFTGGATHGGGSCQVSLSVDKEPTVNSVWKVIHSIIGGCPASSTGNLSGDPTSTGAAKFNYSIPAGVPNGQYTLAWTWLNHIGNREFYMNCAPVTVTGSGAKDGDMSVFNALPDMFVVNLPREQCSTQEGVDFDYPHPGDSVETVVATSLGTSLVGSGCATMTGLGAGLAALQGGGATVTGTGTPTMGSSLATATPASPSTTGGGGGASYPLNGTAATSTSTSTHFVTLTVSSNSKPTFTTPTPPPTSFPSASKPAPSPSPATSNPNKSPCPTDTSEGALLCNGPTQFGLCDHGYVVWRPVAEGTTCDAGRILKKRGVGGNLGMRQKHPHGGMRHVHRFW